MYYWTSLKPLKDFSMDKIKHFSKILNKFNDENSQMLNPSNLKLRDAWKCNLIEYQYKNGKDFSTILELEVDLYKFTNRGRVLKSSDYQYSPRLLLSEAIERFERLVELYPPFKHFEVVLSHKEFS